MITGLRGRSIDPSAKDGMLTAKVGIDATVPIAQRDRFRRIGIPLEIKQSVAKHLASIISVNPTNRATD